MTRQEAQAWKNETQRSKHGWIVDRIHNNENDLLCYMGGESGFFLTYRDNYLSIGTYVSAIPHIGEAIFQVLARQKFNTCKEALLWFVEKAGGRKFVNNDIKKLAYS